MLFNLIIRFLLLFFSVFILTSCASLYGNDNCVRGIVEACFDENSYRTIVKEADNEINSKIGKIISINKRNTRSIKKIESYQLTEELRNIYKEVISNYPNEFLSNINDEYSHLDELKIKPFGKVNYSINENKRVKILSEGVTHDFIEFGCRHIEYFEHDLSKSYDECLKEGESIVNNKHNLKLPNEQAKVFYKTLIYKIKNYRYTKFFREKVYVNSKVYISDSSDSPFIDPIGNVYLPQNLVDKCGKDCIKLVLLHEAFHLINKVDSNHINYFLNGINKGADESENLKRTKGIIHRIYNSFEIENLIDLNVMFYYKDSRYYRELYLKILENKDFKEGSGEKTHEIRLRILKLVNKYMNKHDPYLFMKAAKMQFYLLSYTSGFFNDDMVQNFYMSDKYKIIKELFKTKDEVNIFSDYTKEVNRYLYSENENLKNEMRSVFEWLLER